MQAGKNILPNGIIQLEQSELRNIVHHLRTISSQIKPVKNITLGEYTALNIIGRMQEKEQVNPLTPTKLNEMFGTKKPATSRMLTILEKKGYIERLAEERDHRITHLSLTTRGREILEEETIAYKGLTERVIERMGREELTVLLASLVKLEDILKEEI